MDYPKVIEIFNSKLNGRFEKIKALNLFWNIVGLVGSASVEIGDFKTYNYLIKIANSRFRDKMTYMVKRFAARVMYDIYFKAGYVSRAAKFLKGITYEPFHTLYTLQYLLETANYRKCLNIEYKGEIFPVYVFMFKFYRGLADLFSDVSKIKYDHLVGDYNNLKEIPIINAYYNLYLGIRNYLLKNGNGGKGNLKRALNYFPQNSQMNRILKAILDEDTNHLRNFPREKLLKLYMSGRVYDAVMYAKRKGLTHTLRLYSLLLPKNISSVLNYDIFKDLRAFMLKDVCRVIKKGKICEVEFRNKRIRLKSEYSEIVLTLLKGETIPFNARIYHRLRKIFGDYVIRTDSRIMLMLRLIE